MKTLEKTLRNQLEKAVKEAREVAETAARAALEHLGVGEAGPHARLSENDRDLRRKLRAHGRQLGDIRNPKTETQGLDSLIEEVAYEHWHRMLFARFLAENNLLMYPSQDEPVPVSLEECEDLAADENAKNGWELAARFAARMLPRIFREESPVFELILPPEHQQGLEKILIELPVDVFSASDSLGWVYQFWQAKRKEEINSSEVKRGARELPAVTQLFTEDYMVDFLLDNGLGAWWVRKWTVGSGQWEVDSGKLSEKAGEILRTAENEEELRDFFSIPGVPLSYLRFVKTDHCTLKTGNCTVFNGTHWMPAAGWFEEWPESLDQLKTLDPCCGSGHFLVASFLMLVPIRMKLENLAPGEAVDRVLSQNLHGLELDQRCVELAAFALALTAWRYPDAGGYRPLPEFHLACSGLSVSVAKEEWKKLAIDKRNTRLALDQIYNVFQDAPVLGSLIDPASSDAAEFIKFGRISWEEFSPALEQVLSQEQSDDSYEMGVVAHGLAKSATLLAGKYNWVITNVPYLSRGKQDEKLKAFCEKQYNAGKNDLATVFLDRCLEFCKEGGTTSVVIPQNWLFLTTYRKFRKKLLRNETWQVVARLGAGAFETISGEVVKAILLTLSKGNPSESILSFHLTADQKSNSSQMIRGFDVSEVRSPGEKAAQLVISEVKEVEQAKQLENPDARIALQLGENLPLLGKYADGLVGLQTSDDPMFVSAFWEHNLVKKKIWEYMQSTPDIFNYFAGKSWLVRWEQGKGLLLSLPTAYPTKGLKAIGKSGIAIHRMGTLFPYYYGKERFHQNVAVLIPHNPSHLPAIWCFCSSPEYNEAVRRIDQKLNVTNATLVKVPFDLDSWQKIAEEKYPNGLPKPYSEDPTQWIFHGHPAKTDHPLQVAVARLLGYRWPAEMDSEMELSDEAREWVSRCDKLIHLVDEDGIVCIPPVRGETPAADRLLNLLAASYGDNWRNDILSELLKQADHGGKTLETWLRDKFFVQHCKLFHNRPFIWHVWDGLNDGFAALLNYHKLDYKNLETLIYTYLGDWIIRQKDDIASEADGAEEKLAAAENLKKRLELVLKGAAPCDIFIRWKPIEKQPIGWNPDMNDGVRLNVRPFIQAGDIKKKGAGVLRDKFNVKWKKDRGKDVGSAPWYHLFKGDRINDHHLSLAEKESARKQQKEN